MRMTHYKKSHFIQAALGCLLMFSIISCSKDDDIIVADDDGVTNNLPTGIIMKSIPAQTFTMGSNSLSGTPAQPSAPEHQVTLDAFTMSEAEISNVQYVEFLNNAYNNGLIEIITGVSGPTNGQRLIKGTSLSTYNGEVLYSLDGTRVLKDHNNSDGDGDPFTGVIEPENPLNVSYIGFNTTTSQFYVKDPADVNDFNWVDICNYQNYGTASHTFEGAIINDFDDWAGAGQNLSNELQGWTSSNPSGAVNLPSKSDVSEWPVTFVKWWGAKAFADFYEMNIPTEAQWECSAKAGQNFEYAVYDGANFNDAHWNTLGLGELALGHVRAVISGTENPYGLYNLAGNAWEWIADDYTDPLSTSASTNPLIEISGSTLKCWRGGSWNYHQSTLLTSTRYNAGYDHGNDHFGFRIVSN